MFMGDIDSLSSQEPEFSEKEDDEWILVDFIGKMACTCHLSMRRNQSLDGILA